jgi:hypothetical protein
MRWLSAVARAVFVLACLEAVVSILARWPYQFTGHGDSDRMAQDFLCFGTLLALPLPLASVVVPRAVQLTGGAFGVILFATLLAVALKALAERRATFRS